MTALSIAPAALAQLEDIYDYSFHRWGMARADAYSDALLETIERIPARQFSWRPISSDVGVEGYYRRCGSHLIYWRILDRGDVRVVAILHESMHQLFRLRNALKEDD